MTNNVNNNKKAADVQVKTLKEATAELNKIRNYNKYLNMQVSKLWDSYIHLCDEVASLKAAPKGAE